MHCASLINRTNTDCFFHFHTDIEDAKILAIEDYKLHTSTDINHSKNRLFVFYSRVDSYLDSSCVIYIDKKFTDVKIQEYFNFYKQTMQRFYSFLCYRELDLNTIPIQGMQSLFKDYIKNKLILENTEYYYRYKFYLQPIQACLQKGSLNTAFELAQKIKNDPRIHYRESSILLDMLNLLVHLLIIAGCIEKINVEYLLELANVYLQHTYILEQNTVYLVLDEDKHKVSPKDLQRNINLISTNSTQNIQIFIPA